MYSEMNVPKFPRPVKPRIGKITDIDEMDDEEFEEEEEEEEEEKVVAKSDIITLPVTVSFETTPASRRRRRDVILRGGFVTTRGPGSSANIIINNKEKYNNNKKINNSYSNVKRTNSNTKSTGTSGRCFIKNLVNPHKRIKSRRRVTTEFQLKMTEDHKKSDNDNDNDDVDVVCATVVNQTGIPRSPKLERTIIKNGDAEDRRQELSRLKSTGIQTSPTIPYRLRMLPLLKDVTRHEESSENPKESSTVYKHLRFIGRLSLCQFGLAWLLTLWAIGGAASFYGTEGPREREQVKELSAGQKELAINLATELRLVKAEEPIWGSTVERYVIKHEKLLLSAVSSGYGESGGGGGEVWTFPGCFLFAVSLLTTLGFGAPVPRTTAGRTVAVIFAAIGIPAHFILILNMGIFLAVRLQNFATRRKSMDIDNPSTENVAVPTWVKVVPFACIGAYYLLGIICFGVARLRPTAASLLFPLDFTAAGGLATTSGPVRIAYAIYLEGAVTIAALAVAVLQVSATQSLTNIGLRYGLLTNN